MHVGDSLARAQSSHTRHNGVIRHNDPSTMWLPNSHGAQDQGHMHQRKALRGTSTWVRLSHRRWINKNTAQHRRERKGPKSCAQNKHVRSMCSLGLMLWWGFAWKCSPPSQGFVNDVITKNLNNKCKQTPFPFYVDTQQSNVMLGCKDFMV